MQSIRIATLSTLLLSTSCSEAVPLFVAAPTVAGPTVVLLLSSRGNQREEGLRARRGAESALGDHFDILALDPHDSGWRAALDGVQDPLGVLAWGEAAELQAAVQIWRETTLPVVLASSSPIPNPEEDGDLPALIPRVLPSPAVHARCAAAMLPTGTVVLVHDGSGEGLALSDDLAHLLRPAPVAALALDTGAMATSAAKLASVNAKNLIFSGQPSAGGDLLYTLGRVRSEDKAANMPKVAPAFFGLGLYDARFLESAGTQAEGAWVTTVHRPMTAPEVGEAYMERYGEPPSPAAIDLHDAAKLLLTAYTASEGARGLALREQLGRVTVDSAAGPLSLDPAGEPQPAWCTALELVDGVFEARILARVVGGEVEIMAGKENLPPPPAKPRRPRSQFLAPP